MSHGAIEDGGGSWAEDNASAKALGKSVLGLLGSSQEARVAEWSKHPGKAEIDEAGVVARWSTHTRGHSPR